MSDKDIDSEFDALMKDIRENMSSDEIDMMFQKIDELEDQYHGVDPSKSWETISAGIRKKQERNEKRSFFGAIAEWMIGEVAIPRGGVAVASLLVMSVAVGLLTMNTGLQNQNANSILTEDLVLRSVERDSNDEKKTLIRHNEEKILSTIKTLVYVSDVQATLNKVLSIADTKDIELKLSNQKNDWKLEILNSAKTEEILNLLDIKPGNVDQYLIIIKSVPGAQ